MEEDGLMTRYDDDVVQTMFTRMGTRRNFSRGGGGGKLWGGGPKKICEGGPPYFFRQALKYEYRGEGG